MTALLNRVREIAVPKRDNRSDWLLFGSVAALSVIGVLMIFSATRATGSFSMERQLIFVTAGLIVLAIISNIDYREYRAMVPAAAAVITALLILVLFMPEIENVNRWIPLGFFNLQPAEFAKVVVIVALASLLAPQLSRDELTGPRALTWTKLLQAVVLVAIPGYLILREPDLGTTMVFGFILFGVLFLGGATWRQMLAMTAGLGLGILAVWQFEWLGQYQQDRIRVLIDPTIDPQGIGYQLAQSKNAIGSGQFFGKGWLSEDTLTAFQYVPEQENDFIFTAVAEQFGFVGGLVVLALFGIVIWRLLVIAVNARDRFGALIVGGVAAMISFHVFINIGMTIGIMPITGLPLPFLSQGGSFYLAMMLAIGVCNSVWLLRTPVPTENQLI